MAFVVVLLLTIATLVRVESSAARQTINQLEAEQNAFLGMLIGLGRLQAEAGDDRRVTSNTELDSVVGSQNPHWTAVWKESRTVPELQQMRENLYDEPFYGDAVAHQKLNAQRELVGYLVSGEMPDPAVDLTDAEVSDAVNILPHPQSLFKVVASGQIPDYSSAEFAYEDVVRVKSEPIDEVGRFAYWVADEGLKVRWNINEPDYLSELNVTANDYYQRLATPQKASVLETDNYKISDMSAYTEVVAKSIENSDVQHLDSSMMPQLLHDVTVDSMGLLTDVKFGGNKWDLTHFYQAPKESVLNPETGDALDDLDLVPYYIRLDLHKDWRPNMALLRSFLNPSLADSQAGPGAAIRVRGHEDGKTHGFFPVIGALSLYVDFTNTNGQLRMHMFPTVILWNPYNHPLAAQDYQLDLEFVAIYMLRILNADTRKWTIPLVKYDMLSGDVYTSEYEKDEDGEYVEYLNYVDPVTKVSSVIERPENGSMHYFYKFESESKVGNSGNGIGFDNSSDADAGDVNRIKFEINALSLEPGEVAFLHLKDSLAELGAVGGDGESNELVKNAIDALNDQHSMYIDTGIALPTGALEFSFGYYHPTYHQKGDDGTLTTKEKLSPVNLMYWMPRLSVEETNSEGGTVRTVVHEIIQAVGTTSSGSIGSAEGLDGSEYDKVLWSKMRDYSSIPQNVPLTGNVTRGRIPDLSYNPANPASKENKYTHEYAFRGPFVNSAPYALRYLADFNYRASNSFANNVRYEYPTDFVTYMGYRGDKFEFDPEGFIVGNLASFAHPINFLGPFFEAPVGVEPLSLGVLQHTNWTNMVTSPSYALGNSLVSPMLYRNQLMKGPRTGANPHSGSTRNDVDLSYFLNDSLLDRFYFSGLPQEATWDPADPLTELPNTRLTRLGSSVPTATELQTLQGAADHYGIAGAFNINSTSVYAWTRMLSTFEGLVAPTRDGSVRAEPVDGSGDLRYPNPFARSQFPAQGQADYQDPTYEQAAHLNPRSYQGYRSLSSGEVQVLATEIVRLIKERGPFMSLSDFANRRVSDTDDGLMGLLQQAIDASGVNSDFNDESYNDIDQIRLIPEHNTGPTGRNLPGFLSQADIIDALAPVMSARSDTFRVRGYGERVYDVANQKTTAVCEAVVQRMPQSIVGDGNFGRRYQIVSFRWLNSDDI